MDRRLKRDALCKLFVGGLKRDTQEETFREYFSRFGTLTDCVIITDKSRVSRGFGFVSYEDPDIVDEILIGRPHTIDDKEVDVRRATPKNQMMSGQPQAPRSRKIFIGGLHKDVTEDEIREFFDSRFSKLGNVQDVDIKKTREGENRGFGFVIFENEDVPERILLEEMEISFHGKRCNIKNAIPKETQDQLKPRNLMRPIDRFERSYDRDYRDPYMDRRDPYGPPLDKYDDRRGGRYDRGPSLPPPPPPSYGRRDVEFNEPYSRGQGGGYSGAPYKSRYDSPPIPDTAFQRADGPGGMYDNYNEGRIMSQNNQQNRSISPNMRGVGYGQPPVPGTRDRQVFRPPRGGNRPRPY